MSSFLAYSIPQALTHQYGKCSIEHMTLFWTAPKHAFQAKCQSRIAALTAQIEQLCTSSSLSHIGFALVAHEGALIRKALATVEDRGPCLIRKALVTVKAGNPCLIRMALATVKAWDPCLIRQALATVKAEDPCLALFAVCCWSVFCILFLMKA